jgi:hypothetical protein
MERFAFYAMFVTIQERRPRPVLRAAALYSIKDPVKVGWPVRYGICGDSGEIEVMTISFEPTVGSTSINITDVRSPVSIRVAP